MTAAKPKTAEDTANQDAAQDDELTTDDIAAAIQAGYERMRDDLHGDQLVGITVLHVLSVGQSVGQIRPAIVTRSLPATEDQPERQDLTVFCAIGDGIATQGCIHQQVCRHDASGAPGTWHWPGEEPRQEEEEAAA